MGENVDGLLLNVDMCECGENVVRLQMCYSNGVTPLFFRYSISFSTADAFQ